MILKVAVDQNERFTMQAAIMRTLDRYDLQFDYNAESGQLSFECEDEHHVQVAQLMRDEFSNFRNVISLS